MHREVDVARAKSWSDVARGRSRSCPAGGGTMRGAHASLVSHCLLAVISERVQRMETAQQFCPEHFPQLCFLRRLLSPSRSGGRAWLGLRAAVFRP